MIGNVETLYIIISLVPRPLSVFLMLHAIKREDLADFHDVMDVVWDDVHWNELSAHAYVELSELHASSYESTCGLIIHSNARHPKPHPSRHENQPGLLVF